MVSISVEYVLGILQNLPLTVQARFSVAKMQVLTHTKSASFKMVKSTTVTYLLRIISEQGISSVVSKNPCLRRLGLTLWLKFQNVRKERNAPIQPC